MYEPGIRVGAVSHNDKDTLYLFGYGVYEGDELQPRLNFPNPKIVLDNGDVVWGCECWWGPEDAIKETAAAYANVVTLNIKEERKDAGIKDDDPNEG